MVFKILSKYFKSSQNYWQNKNDISSIGTQCIISYSFFLNTTSSTARPLVHRWNLQSITNNLFSIIYNPRANRCFCHSSRLCPDAKQIWRRLHKSPAKAEGITASAESCQHLVRLWEGQSKCMCSRISQSTDSWLPISSWPKYLAQSSAVQSCNGISWRRASPYARKNDSSS